MIIQVDLESPVPPFEQLRGQLETMIRSGALPPEERLPPIRQLAADLGIATGTVARAYAELEEQKLVRGSGRRGTIVLGTLRARPKKEQEELLKRAARVFATEAARLGTDRRGAIRAVEAEVNGLLPS